MPIQLFFSFLIWDRLQWPLQWYCRVDPWFLKLCMCVCLPVFTCLYVCAHASDPFMCVFLSQHVVYMLACFSRRVLSMQWSLCCSKRVSAVSDGGDSLEATHQGDAIARVCMHLCVCEREWCYRMCLCRSLHTEVKA